MFNSLTFSNIEFFAGGGLSVGGEEGQDGGGGDQVSQMELLFLVAAFRSGKMEQKGWLAIANWNHFHFPFPYFIIIKCNLKH